MTDLVVFQVSTVYEVRYEYNARVQKRQKRIQAMQVLWRCEILAKTSTAES